MRQFAVSTACLLLLCVPATAQEGQKATASFVNLEGQQIGNAELLATPHGVLIELDLRGLPAGEHALHIHEKGICDISSKFSSAGGHFAPHGEKHGYLSVGGPHAGDMPNQFVGADGVLRAHVLDGSVTLGNGENSLLAPQGTALVIHAKADDYQSQPAGNAGERIACAVIKQK